MRALVLSSLVLLGCPLPTNVRYRCETDGSCKVKGQVCGPDLYCHLPGELSEDGGLALDGGGPCVRRAVDCSSAECGFLFDGCDFVDCRALCPAPRECGVERPNRCDLPRQCTSEGWCWENPLPQGNTLHASWRLDGRHTWFVGEARTILFHDGERSTLQDNEAPPATELLAVSGTSATDVYAVGTQAVIVHFDGTRWQREQANSPVSAALRAVLSFGDGGALAGGNGGLLLTRRAALEPEIRWAVENLGVTDDVRDIVLDPEGRALVLTRRNQLFVRGANGWELWDRVNTLQDSFTATTWRGGLLVAGNGPNGLTLAALPPDAGRDGGNWEPIDAGLGPVLDLKPGDGGVFLVSQLGVFGWLDDDGGMLRLNTNLQVPMTAVPYEGHTLFAAGLSGLMVNVNLDNPNPTLAVTPRSTPLVRRSDLNALCGSSPTQLYAMGGFENNFGSPRWLERAETANGVEWRAREFALGGTNRLLGCFADPAGDRAWFTGDDTKFIYLAGGIPNYGDFGGFVGGQYSAAWASRDAGFFFVRTDPQLTFSPDGMGPFTAVDVGNGANDLRGVWGLGGDDIVTVGLQGSLSRFDGLGWSPSTVGTDDLEAIHGVLLNGQRRYVIAGLNGTVVTIDGPNAPSRQVVDALAQLHEVWVSPGGVAWVGGAAADGGGLVLRQSAPGAGWEVVPFNSPREVNGLFGAGGETVWVVGDRGMILRRP